MRHKAFLASNTAWSLVNFRGNLIRELLSAGWEVIAAAPPDEFTDQLLRMGCRYIALEMDNKGVNPIQDAALLLAFYRLLRSERPTVFLGCTIKPNVYGSLAARALGIPAINNITGLGTAFIRSTWITRVARALYRIALAGSHHVFFENNDDLDLFLTSRLVKRHVAEYLPITGVDMNRFVPVATARPPDDKFRFTLVSRMLWDKGVGEFVTAAQEVRTRHPHVDFCLVGFVTTKNRTAISTEQISEWEKSGIVRYLGAPPDVRPYIADADCIVLPSYREGLPVALLEAASMGKPIIATDTVGCREVVEDGVNGYLVRVGDAGDLANKMEILLNLRSEHRSEMGRNGRRLVEARFDASKTTARYMTKLVALSEMRDKARLIRCARK